jgi:hypothetical protein
VQGYSLIFMYENTIQQYDRKRQPQRDILTLSDSFRIAFDQILILAVFGKPESGSVCGCITVELEHEF